MGEIRRGKVKERKGGEGEEARINFMYYRCVLLHCVLPHCVLLHCVLLHCVLLQYTVHTMCSSHYVQYTLCAVHTLCTAHIKYYSVGILKPEL